MVWNFKNLINEKYHFLWIENSQYFQRLYAGYGSVLNWSGGVKVQEAPQKLDWEHDKNAFDLCSIHTHTPGLLESCKSVRSEVQLTGADSRQAKRRKMQFMCVEQVLQPNWEMRRAGRFSGSNRIAAVIFWWPVWPSRIAAPHRISKTCVTSWGNKTNQELYIPFFQTVLLR